MNCVISLYELNVLTKMKPSTQLRLSTILFMFSLSTLLSGCGGTTNWEWDPIGSIIESKKKARRAEQYRDLGADPKRASRLAFEDQTWGDL